LASHAIAAGSAGCQVATTCAAHYESAAGSIATWDGKIGGLCYAISLGFMEKHIEDIP